MEVSTLKTELEEGRAQEHLREALAEQIFELENLLKTQQRRVAELLEQNQELMSLEVHLASQLEEREEDARQFQQQRTQYQDQQIVLHELERELKEAASLTEQQNLWNQQLTVELEHLELEKAEQMQLIETLEATEEAFSTGFTTLFTQYMQLVAASKKRLVQECGGIVGDNQKSPTVYDEAVTTGNVLQMLRVFPTLIEEYLAGTMLGIHQHSTKDLTRSKQRPAQGAAAARPRPARAMQSPQEPPRDLSCHGDALEEPPLLDTQLQEIAQAFGKFKTLR